MKNLKFFLVLVVLLGLSACDNNDSIGDDVEDVGESIEDAAD